ncbi:MAG TPA: pyridoxal phosphate-dependent aminotransferase [Longimicrobiales bacterium]|nr:pyridoxal phosphate-dependent aminotransferase [Longimicrobiales bacterium]
MRGGAQGKLLFDSTIAEPSQLLFASSLRALNGGGERIRSTFGWGSPLLIDSIARRYGVPPEHILTTTGCTSALSHVYSAFLEPGTRVLIERPYFDLLPRLAQIRGATVDFVDRDPDDGTLDPARLEAALYPDTRLVVLTNLHNPSGAFLDDAALRRIAAVVSRHGIPVVVDEVYGDFVPRSRRSGPAAKLDPCFISINSLTKVYGLHALKCGWIIAAEPALGRIRRVYAELESGSSKITHGIASLILDELEPYEAYWQGMLAGNRPLVLEMAERLRGEGLIEGSVPEFGCMYFPRLTGIRDTRRFAAWAWQRSRLGIAPGGFFGAPGYIRIGYGQPRDELAAGLEDLAACLRQYPGDGA